MAKKVKDENLTGLRLKFDEVTYNGLIEYARRNDFSRAKLASVLSGNYKIVTLEVIDIYKQLKKDGIYTDELFPWEKSKKSA